VLHWPGFFKELGFNSPTSYWFCQKKLCWWNKYVIEKINSKSWESIFNFCTYLVITLSLKIGQMIKIKYISIWSKLFIFF
jgi:hypothetical protein